MAVKVAPMYYVVTKALARAMETGARCKKGTVYGIFSDPIRAYQYRHEKGLSLVTVVIEQ